MGPAVSLVENPNGFAYFMTLMIPLYLYFYQKSHHKYIRLGFLGLALAAVYIVLNTGSRTGLLALIAVGAFLLPKYGAQHKMTIVVAVVAVAVFASSLGAMNIQRFKSIPQSIASFLSGEEEKPVSEMNQDEQSAYERKMKNKHTFSLFLHYPIFGVGLKANDNLVMEKFHYAGGQVHNEILYAAKQMGLVGMLLYLSFMRMIFVYGSRIQKEYKQSWPVLSDLGWTFKMQAVVFMVGGFFSPIPWNPLYLIIAGSASALLANLENRSYNLASESI
ncbi:MAG: O-antigen ligase family protein, partial [Kiritimatiellae bacterium]|nr:O-antigen ligase family protein [Kiritimatiellia bacterium]